MGWPRARASSALFYNRAIMKKLGLEPPTTMQEFEDSLAKAKEAGEVPIQGADGDAQATDWGLMTAAAMNADTDHVRDTYLGRADGGFDTPEMMAAIKAAESWGDKGYYPEGFRGRTSDVAAGRFMKGEGLYFINGTWWSAGIKDGLKGDAGFMAPPPGPGGESATIAAPNQPWAIPAKAKDKLAAALWIDFVTSSGEHRRVPGERRRARDEVRRRGGAGRAADPGRAEDRRVARGVEVAAAVRVGGADVPAVADGAWRRPAGREVHA